MPTPALHVEAEQARRPVPRRTRRPLRRSGILQADLRGFSQVPPVLTPATGTFLARVTENAVEYELSYENLSSDAFAAHIHFGRPDDNGGVLVVLCGGGDKPACPLRGGVVRGTVRAEDVLAVPEQGVEAGDAAGLLRIIRAGLAYVNVHTQNFPEGEIRGQIR